MKKIILFNFLIVSYLSAQEFSLGFGYSSILSSNNYIAYNAYTIEGDFNLIENKLNLVVSISFTDNEFKEDFISHRVEGFNVDEYGFESSVKISLGGRYFYFQNIIEKIEFKLFLGLEIGTNLSPFISTTKSNTPPCWENITFKEQVDYFADFNTGIIIFPTQHIGFKFSVNYLLRDLKLNYEVPNCQLDEVFQNYEETLFLRPLLWSLGVQFNF